MLPSNCSRFLQFVRDRLVPVVNLYVRKTMCAYVLGFIISFETFAMSSISIDPSQSKSASSSFRSKHNAWIELTWIRSSFPPQNVLHVKLIPLCQISDFNVFHGAHKYLFFISLIVAILSSFVTVEALNAPTSFPIYGWLWSGLMHCF